MQGLIFVTWEKYLSERFGSELLQLYRRTLGETAASSPLTSRVYDDAALLAGVEIASRLTLLTPDTLLREYGRYFIINGLTRHLCAYLLNQAHSGHSLLLAMRDAHAQMRRTPEKLIPPLFAYEVISANLHEFALIYDSPRQMCSLLWGAIEGAAERYGERVHIIERSCMKHGAPVCRLEVSFSPGNRPVKETPEQIAQRLARQRLANLVLASLPEYDGITLQELQKRLNSRRTDTSRVRPHMLLEALQHLQHAGLACSSANQPGDSLANRRYWRAPTSGTTQF